MTAEQNKDLVRHWFARIDTGNPAVVDEFLATDYADYNPPPYPTTNEGREAARDRFHLALQVFSDFEHHIEDMIAEGDKVVTRITTVGTHTGELLGIPPTGKRVTMRGIAIHRIKDGKLVEHWAQFDALGLLQQLGAIPAPEPVPAEVH